MFSEEDYAAVALSRVPAIGAKLYKSLITSFGSAKAALDAPPGKLVAVPGIAARTAAYFKGQMHRREAEHALSFCARNGVSVLRYGEADYPVTLGAFADAPPVLYYRGEASPGSERNVAIVGTRSMTAAGRRQVERLIDGLKGQDVAVVSGLAYGIDTAAHEEALRIGLPTIAVMGSGFEHIYPYSNRKLAHRMIESCGGLLTEYPPWQKPQREHFPARNRIVAMMSKMVIVVESDVAGGSIITANMAGKYGRVVGACPGRAGDRAVSGCNQLIKDGKASLVESGEDVLKLLGWGSAGSGRKTQPLLFETYTEAEQSVVDCLRERERVSIDELRSELSQTTGQLAATLLALELRGTIATLPGQRYRMAVT